MLLKIRIQFRLMFRSEARECILSVLTISEYFLTTFGEKKAYRHRVDVWITI